MTYLWNVHKRQNICFSHGKGCYLFSSQPIFKKNKYLDFNSGGGVNSLGYSHPKLVSAITKQAKRIWHLSNYFENKMAENLSKKLSQLSGLDKVFFVNSGAEGVEFAFKVARKFFFNQNKEKYEIMSLKMGYHGRTLGALSASANEFYRKGFGPLLEGFIHAEANIQDIKQKITPKTACIIIEPIQGNEGMKFLGWKFLKELRELCTENDILLILDEIQTGIGRTGKFFAYEHANIKPDILILAKGIAGGFPLGAVLSNEDIANSIPISGHGGTFGGNLLGISVAEETIKQISNKKFLEHVTFIAKIIDDELNALHKLFPNIIDEVRGFGLMRGLKINKNINLEDLMTEALKEHLILGSASGGILRITPPLIITEEEFKIGINKIKTILSKL